MNFSTEPLALRFDVLCVEMVKKSNSENARSLAKSNKMLDCHFLSDLVYFTVESLRHLFL